MKISIRPTLSVGFILTLSTIALGSEVRLNIFSSPEKYEFNAIIAPTAFLTFIVAIALYVGALILPDNFSERADRVSLFRRFSAFFIDFTICAVTAFIPILVVILGIEALETGEVSLAVERDYRKPTDVIATTSIWIGMVLVLGLVSLPLSLGRRSVGTIIAGYKIRMDRRLGIGATSLRSIVGYIALCGALLSVPMSLRRDDRRMWHDLAFDTTPVLTDDAT